MGRLRRFIPVAEWEDARHRRGYQGEIAAARYLEACGWAVEAHRFRLGRHDLDLVVRRGRVVAFVEVKTRRGSAAGAPLESLGRRQRAALAKVAEVWRLRFGRPGDEYRFDLVGVSETPRGTLHIEHVPDAWRIG